MSMVAELASPFASSQHPTTQPRLTVAPNAQVASRMIRHALQKQDELVVSLNYRDKKGKTTQRIISPIRFLAPDRFLAMCLCRCEPRQFQLDRCSDVQLKWAADYVMPVQMSTVGN